MSFPYQKSVTIMPRKRDKDHLYAMVGINAASKATRLLNGSGFKLWFYLNKNIDNYKADLSQKACEKWGIKKDSYYSAVDELIEKNYLIPLWEGSRIFQFYENGDGEKPKVFSENPNRKAENQNNVSGNQSEYSENPRRNNTDITIKNTTPITAEIGERYSYLEDNYIILGDGSFTTEDGESTWLDRVEYGFWEYSREDKIKAVMKHVHLSREEAEYAVDVILNS